MAQAYDDATHAQHDAELTPLPKRIGARYEVIERIGRGGMAVVYRVRDRSRAGDLALKQFIAAGGSRDQDLRALFEREYRVLAQLQHPSVVEVYDFGIDEAGPYYTMELLDGGDMSSRAPLPVPQACEVIAEICSSLSLLHSRGFVHRDVSPRNVRFTRDGRAKLIDFGAMVPAGPCAQGVGTPGFVAPEVIHHLNLDARTDLFSVGATLHYALTGKRPFAARTLAELPAAWQKGPATLADDGVAVPAALEALVQSTLQMDPARRPGSAFEVRQRLAAVSGKPLAESAEIVSAYLSTPILVGRDAELRQFRHFMRRMLQGDGLGLMLQGASGTGRSRLLAECVLEVEASGAIVLRADGRGARGDAFATVHRLAQQLIDALPEEAAACAEQAGVAGVVFADEPSGPVLPPPARWVENRDALQTALPAWFEQVCRRHAIAIAIDDVERIDDASLGVLVGLVHAASGARLLVLTATVSTLDANAPAALAILQGHCTSLAVAPLLAADADDLFGSVFSGAPHVPLVSDRIHKLAAGNPRDMLALAHDMIDRGMIRYDGTWVLPERLAVGDLPASAGEALRAHLDGLTPLPRLLIESQALALEGPWTARDYSELAPDTSADAIAQALGTLVREGLLVENERAYTLSHPGVRVALCTGLDAVVLRERERGLANMCTRTGRPELVAVMHLLRAEDFPQALERLSRLVRGTPVTDQLVAASGLDHRLAAEIAELAQPHAAACGRSVREQHELQRILIDASTQAGSQYYQRYAPVWLVQVERDSGLADYRAADPNKPAAERLQSALQAAVTRYSGTPEAERVYRVDEAIKALSRFVSLSIAIAAQTMDPRLFASLPEMLEPFSSLSPVVYALWQNATAIFELSCKGQYERARTRLLDVHARLTAMSAGELEYRDLMRYAVSHAVAMIDVSLGRPSAEHWLSVMEEDALQRVNARYLRRAQSIFDGDTEAAERYRKQAEVLAVQASTRQMFEPPLTLELYLQVHAGDLTGVKHAADRIAVLAEKWPGWRSQHHFAQASFHRLRGDLPAAKAEFELALAASDPDQTDPPPLMRAWAAVAEGYVGVLEAMGSLEQARAFAERARAICEARELTGFYGIERSLALVEARLGQHARAAARLDAMIERRSELRPSLRALDFEARAKVAIWAGDGAAANHFTRLATEGVAAETGVQHLARRGRLLDEAQRAGMVLDIAQSGFESAIKTPSVRPEHAHARAAQGLVAAAFGPLADSGARAQRALELLAEALVAPSGQLYYASGMQLTRCATVGEPVPLLDRFANGYWRHRRQQAAMTTVFTAPQLSAFGLPTGAWTSPAGTPYVLIPLSPVGESECVGLAAFAAHTGPIPAEFWALAAAISAKLLAAGDVAPPAAAR